MDPYSKKLNSTNYGQDFLCNKEHMTLRELGESAIRLHFLEKSLKSQRRLEKRKEETKIDELVNEKYKYDKNAIVGRKFPFKAEDFKYPNDGVEKPKSLYIKFSSDYGKQKPNELELPEKFFPIDNKFTNGFTYNYKNNSLNCAPSYSKVHKAFDSIY